jgi:shikimate kinase
MITAEAPIETMPRRTPIRRSPAAAKIERLVLTGFMGSGKTVIGRQLAAALGWEFQDLDTEIERRCGLSVPEIFARFGEPHFRRQESAALAALLGRTRVVIALGGGAPEDLGNRLLLEQTPSTEVIFLAAPFATLVARCEAQPNATARPVLADREKAAQRFETRQRIYHRIANHKLETSTMTPDETLEALLTHLTPKIAS